MQEILVSIQRTLNHPYVGRMYIFYQDIDLINYIEKQSLKNVEKIEFVPNLKDTMDTLFRFANSRLIYEVVMVTNADVYPDEGFDQLNLTRLKEKKIVYLLSR